MLLSQIPDPVKVPYSCPVCHVEFPSFATWTRKDADHYTASRNYSTGAAKRYADEIGSCYRCNKTLTDDESRRLGIGPTCRSRA